MKAAKMLVSSVICCAVFACGDSESKTGSADDAGTGRVNGDKTDAGDTLVRSRSQESADSFAAVNDSLTAETSSAAINYGEGALQSLSQLGSAVDSLPATGGTVLQLDADTQVDLDGDGNPDPLDFNGDGVPDAVSVVKTDDQMLWLIESDDFADFACPTQAFFITDNPPEAITSWGFYSETCGSMACPASQLDVDTLDMSACTCIDETGASLDCVDLEAIVVGDTTQNPDPSTGQDQTLECPSGETIYLSDMCDGVQDCSDGSDEHPDVCTFAACDNGEEIPVAFFCDGEPDCSDGSDESAQLCEATTPQPASP